MHEHDYLLKEFYDIVKESFGKLINKYKDKFINKLVNFNVFKYKIINFTSNTYGDTPIENIYHFAIRRRADIISNHVNEHKSIEKCLNLASQKKNPEIPKKTRKSQK